MRISDWSSDVCSSDLRIAWLDGARALDLALRGPRPAPGLDGIDAHLAEGDERTRVIRGRAREWWRAARPLLEPIGAVFDDGPQPLGALLAALREEIGRAHV